MNLRKGDIAPFEDVLTELLNPTDEMIEAMVNTDQETLRISPYATFEERAKQIWSAAIQKALES